MVETTMASVMGDGCSCDAMNSIPKKSFARGSLPRLLQGVASGPVTWAVRFFCVWLNAQMTLFRDNRAVTVVLSASKNGRC